MELDDSDVYTMSKLGKLALKCNQLDIAQTAFEKVIILVFSNISAINKLLSKNFSLI